MVDAVAFELAAEALAVAAGKLAVGHAHVGVVGVDHAAPSGFLVPEDDRADIREIFLERIGKSPEELAAIEFDVTVSE